MKSKNKSSLPFPSRENQQNIDNKQLDRLKNPGNFIKLSPLYFKVYSFIWKILLITYPLDFLLIYLLTKYSNTLEIYETFQSLAFSFLVLGFILGMEFLETHIIQALSTSNKRKLINIFIFIAALNILSLIPFLIELLKYFKIDSIGFLITVLVYGIAIISIIKGFNQEQNQENKLSALKLEYQERVLLIIKSLPIFLIRLSCLLMGFYQVNNPDYINYFGFFITCLILHMSDMPKSSGDYLNRKNSH